jgi:hypothetical protein
MFGDGGYELKYVSAHMYEDGYQSRGCPEMAGTRISGLGRLFDEIVTVHGGPTPKACESIGKCPPRDHWKECKVMNIAIRP